nr:AAA family ATPase [uncultured Desulfobacter sp.]
MIFETLNENELQLIHQGERSRLFRYNAGDDKRVLLIKVARSHSPLSRQATLFANELKITRNLNCPGIRKALQTGNVGGSPAVCLEFIDGVSLRDYCAENKPDLLQMVSLGVGIAKSLAGIHGAHTIHRNLSSTHVMVGRDHKPVLIDFSIALANPLGRESHPSDRLEGNLAYISPEQTGRINRVVDYRTDLYALGVMLYEMLSGQLPFTGTPTELIHAHIARKPRPLIARNPELPNLLSDIVMRLLSKSTEERYQSAVGVARDLERCLTELRGKGRIQSFDLGRDDISARLLIPQRLYGRQKAWIMLDQAFCRTEAGSKGFMHVTGPDGVGKTALVSELKQRVIEKKGIFVTGAYDQYQRKVPYHGLNLIFSALAGILCTYPTHKLALLRSYLKQETESWQGVLTAVLPGLQMLVTDDAPPNAVPLTLPRPQLGNTIYRVLLLLAKECGPLVMVLDHLQWADTASLEVIKLLAMDNDNGPLLTIGIFNDQQGRNKGLMNILDTESSENSLIQKIELNNLDRKSLSDLIKDIIKKSGQDTEVFGNMVFDKTGGNPLLAVEFIQSLYNDGALRFNFDAGHWCWDEPAVRNKALVDDVITSVHQKLEHLATPVQEILMKAACIGQTFSLETLASVLKQPEAEVELGIKTAEKEHLLLGVSSAGASNSGASGPDLFDGRTYFTFSHSRVRQAALSLLLPPNQRMTRLELGRLLLAGYDEARLKQEIFVVVDHLNEGFRYMETDEERLHLAGLNHKAGKRAFDTGAYETAVWYLNMGLGLLPSDKWERFHEKSCLLFEDAIKAEYFNCNFPRVHMLAEELATHAKTPEKIAGARKFQILAHTAQGDRDKAFASALTALEALDVIKPEEMPGVRPEAMVRPELMDLETIIKASHMLSKEIRLDRLTHKLMHIVMENAGAEKGVLVMKLDGKMAIHAKGEAGCRGAEILSPLPLEESHDLPRSVILAVASTQNEIVLGNAQNDPRFSQDPYIIKHKVRSIMGVPITHQAKLVGVFYLENNLATNIFSPSHLQLLKTLLSQAAISMENARLYTSLEEKLQELSTTRDALTESRNWLDRIINTIGEPIFVKDREHRWVLLNDAFCHFLGHSRETLLGKSDYDFCSKDEADIFWQKDELVFTTGEENVNEEKFSDAKGKTHTILTNKTLYTDKKGKKYIVGISRDITERKRMEEMMIQSEKMLSVGGLAAGMAHEINNPLAGIMQTIQVMAQRLKAGANIPANNKAAEAAGITMASIEQFMENRGIPRMIAAIIDSGKRVSEIVTNMLSFARKDDAAASSQNLNTILDKTIELAATDYNLKKEYDFKQISITREYDNGLPDIPCQVGKIQQVLLNILANGAQAMQGAGTPNAGFFIRTYVDSARNMACVEIEDNGPGMDENVRKHIFDPFFTTKPAGVGTGLGLSISYFIITENHKGEIAVESSPGAGAKFIIRLPLFMDTHQA